jgi:hypothetical protein
LGKIETPHAFGSFIIIKTNTENRDSMLKAVREKNKVKRKTHKNNSRYSTQTLKA